MFAFNTLEEFKNQLSEKTLKLYQKFWGNDLLQMIRFIPESYVNSELNTYLKSRQILIKNSRILEFGCRDGSSFISYLNLGAMHIVGMDINIKALKLSESIYRDLGYTKKQIQYRQNFLEKPFPIKKHEFDIISLNAIIEHIKPSYRSKYIKELQNAVKPGGWIIFSDTPNKLWIKEGHTTGLWLINYLPFKIKCWLGSKTRRFRCKLRYNDYDDWIAQGIEGVTYKEIFNCFNSKEWSISHDLQFESEHNEYYKKYKDSGFIKKVYRKFLLIISILMYQLNAKPNGFPSLSVLPSLVCSFQKSKDKETKA